jgi:hypothetical protein
VQATLVKSPVRTGPSMIDFRADTTAPATDPRNRPLAYLFADWNPPAADITPTDLGQYNEDTQTWDAAPGVITAGHWTKSYSSRYGWYTDDACA